MLHLHSVLTGKLGGQMPGHAGRAAGSRSDSAYIVSPEQTAFTVFFYPLGLWPQSLLDRHVSVCPGAKCAEIFKYKIIPLLRCRAH